jgi:hypothetical protein
VTAAERDVAAEMRAVVDAHTSGGPYVPRVAAEEVVEKLRANDPDLLAAWLDAQASHFVWQLINDRDRSLRGRGAYVSRSSVFREAAADHAAGDSTALRSFLAAPYTVSDGSRRPLADLHRDDLIWVAERYEDRSRENGLKAAFMRAVAKKVKTGTVGQHFDDAQLTAMWNSLAVA